MYSNYIVILYYFCNSKNTIVNNHTFNNSWENHDRKIAS